MTSTNNNDLDSLLEERARYERWIAQLTAKRDQTPPHVFERVRSDYSARLDTVLGQLRSHGEELLTTATSIEQRATAIASEEQQRRDARAEIELRAMVGEYSTERANMELAAIDAELGRLETERATTSAELGRLKEILALVKQPDARPAAPSTSRPLGAQVPRGESASTLQELAFLNSVVERAEPVAAAPAPAPAPVPVAPAPVAPAPIAAAPAPKVVEDVPLVTSLEVSDRPEPQTAASEASRHVPGTPAFLKGMPTEQVKSLKCQECGTMNYPTEWYCERCGGELATM
jgi:hypothetical protein